MFDNYTINKIMYLFYIIKKHMLKMLSTSKAYKMPHPFHFCDQIFISLFSLSHDSLTRKGVQIMSDFCFCRSWGDRIFERRQTEVVCLVRCVKGYVPFTLSVLGFSFPSIRTTRTVRCGYELCPDSAAVFNSLAKWYILQNYTLLRRDK